MTLAFALSIAWHLDRCWPGAELLQTLSASVAQQKLQRCPALSSAPGATAATLRTVCAGRAQNRALQGKPVHQVLQVSERRSSAVLNYAWEGAFDKGALLAQTVQASDDESEAKHACLAAAAAQAEVDSWPQYWLSPPEASEAV